MKRPTTLLCLLVLLMACDQRTRDGSIVPIRPTATPDPTPAPSPAPIARSIRVGEEAKGVFKGLAQVFEFTAPANGRLVARLTWDVWFNGTILTLQLLGGTEYKPAPPWSPMVGTWNVTAGQTYRLTIDGGGTDWFYDDPFVLTTAVE